MMRNSHSVLQSNKKKFPHSTSKAIFVSTFFIQQQICYIIQCQSGQVFVGHFDTAFNIIWQDTFKHHITCISHCHKHHILYAGTKKGSILAMDFNSESQKNKLEINPINGQPILSMFAYSNDVEQTPELIAINNQGIIRKYKSNKYEASVNLPFKIGKSVCNKTIKSKIDIAMVVLKQNGKFPYIFSPQILFDLFTKNQQQINNLLSQYEKSLSYEPDQLIQTSQVQYLAISNTKSILVTAYKDKVTIFGIEKEGKWFKIFPDFKFLYQVNILNLDLVDAKLLYTTQKGIGTFDVQTRTKVANGLTFSGTQYQIGFWCQLPHFIIYGTSLTPKMKLISCQLKDIKKQ